MQEESRTRVIDVTDGPDGRSIITLDFSDEDIELIKQVYGVSEVTDEVAQRVLTDALAAAARFPQKIGQDHS
jgi:hypothetical protein